MGKYDYLEELEEEAYNDKIKPKKNLRPPVLCFLSIIINLTIQK